MILSFTLWNLTHSCSRRARCRECIWTCSEQQGIDGPSIRDALKSSSDDPGGNEDLEGVKMEATETQVRFTAPPLTSLKNGKATLSVQVVVST